MFKQILVDDYFKQDTYFLFPQINIYPTTPISTKILTYNTWLYIKPWFWYQVIATVEDK